MCPAQKVHDKKTDNFLKFNLYKFMRLLVNQGFITSDTVPERQGKESVGVWFSDKLPERNTGIYDFCLLACFFFLQ